MNYQGVSCPVCGRAFMPEDDVVVCPECGTPHHRECYTENKGCANASHHGEEFSFAAPPEAVSPEEDELLKQTEGAGGKVSSPEELRLFIEQAQRQAEEPHEGTVPFGEATPFDYETAVIVKPGYYLPRFMLMKTTGRKVLWNIMAFFFPFSWAAYRRMYSLAAIFMAVNILFLGANAYTVSLNPSMKEAVAVYKAAEADGVISDSELESISAALTTAQQTEYTVPRILSLFMNLEIADNIIMGLFATFFYKQKIEKTVSKLKDGVIEYPEYTAKLTKKGGVAILPVLIGYAVYAAAFMVIINLTFGF